MSIGRLVLSIRRLLLSIGRLLLSIRRLLLSIRRLLLSIRRLLLSMLTCICVHGADGNPNYLTIGMRNHDIPYYQGAGLLTTHHDYSHADSKIIWVPIGSVHTNTGQHTWHAKS